MKYFLLVPIVSLVLLIAGCDSNQCNEKIHNSIIAVDISDSSISNLFREEQQSLVTKTAPQLQRCEGIHYTLVPIGAKIENKDAEIFYPASRVIEKTLGNYDVEDSNT